MKSKYGNFDFRDRVLLEMNFLVGAWGVLYSVDPDQLSTEDMQHFCNGLAWHTEFLKNELEDFLFPGEEIENTLGEK